MEIRSFPPFSGSGAHGSFFLRALGVCPPGESRRTPSTPSVPPASPSPAPSPPEPSAAPPKGKKNLRRKKSCEQPAAPAFSIVLLTSVNDRKEILCSGSGILLGTKGFLLTSFHPVRGGTGFLVRVETGDRICATDEILKYSQDLAVLRIDRRLKPLPFCRGRKKLSRGERAVAIGPLPGRFSSVSDGIISGVPVIRFTASADSPWRIWSPFSPSACGI